MSAPAPGPSTAASPTAEASTSGSSAAAVPAPAADPSSAPDPPPGHLDLDAYLDRIGYAGPRAADLATLAGIVRAQAQTIPFENLNPFLGWPVLLDLATLQDKLVRQRRGGYCFELNRLLQAALEQLGFEVTALGARVVWGQPDDAVTARGHMLLRVEVAGASHLVDVGFGGQTLTAPLRLEAGVEQPTPHGPFRLVERGDELLQQVRLPDGWRTTYRFDLRPQYDVDFEVANYYLSTHPSSHFVTGLVAARPADDRRYALHGRRLTVHHLDGRTERRELTGPDELRATLERDLHLEVPAHADLDAAFGRLP